MNNQLALHIDSADLVQTLNTAAGNIQSRPSWQLLLRQLDAQSGIVGRGEAAPLPAFGGEDAATCVSALARLPRQATYDGYHQLLTSLPPCAAFALSTALAEFAARQAGLPLHCWWTQSTPSNNSTSNSSSAPVTYISVNALARNPGEVAHLAAEGWPLIKLKLPADIAIADTILTDISAHLQQSRLRGDANGAWNRDQADWLLRRHADLAWDYLEQPCPSLADLAWLQARHAVAIAADESIRQPADLDHVIALHAAQVVVLKPMLLGSTSSSLAMIQTACQAGLRVVVTGVLESGIGRAAVAHLAAASNLHDEYHGLATGHLLQHDLPVLSLRGHHLLFDDIGLGPL